MKTLLAKKVHIAWLLVVSILAAASFIIWKVAILDATPSNSVLITGTGTPSSVASSQSPVAGNSVLSPQPSVLVTPTQQTIAVYVSGAILKPGVYMLPVGSRVGDALDAAGGQAEGADLERVNLAMRLDDEDHLAVPRKGQALAPDVAPVSNQEAAPESRTEPMGKININIAGAQEIESLPGIGVTLAAKIVAYREANGPFAAIDDIQQVPGIKDGLFARIRDYITVEP